MPGQPEKPTHERTRPLGTEVPAPSKRGLGAPPPGSGRHSARGKARTWLLLFSISLVALATGWVQAAPKAPPGTAPQTKQAKSQTKHTPQAGLVHGLAPLPGDAPVPLSDRPPGALTDDGGPSPVIFPAQKLTIRFNHKKHSAELGMTCTTCHDAATKSRKSSDRLLPEPVRCDGCHGTDHRDLNAVRGDPEELMSQCGFCHIGYKPGDGNRVARMVIPNPNLRFNHKAHLDRNIGCAQCHGKVESIELATRDQLPRMKGCLKCHHAPEPSRGEAKGDCTTCHLTAPGGTVMRTEFATGQLKPPRWLHNSGHTPDWIARHKHVAGADSQVCASCHTEKYCTDCHDGRVRPRKVHPNDFISMHPIAARQNSPRCTSCHQQQSFCVGCHQRAGVTLSGPYANFEGRGRFHPPKDEWTDPPRSAGHHAWEAQRNINACVSCHQERDCVACHSTTQVGGRGIDGMGTRGQGVNPHPTGFHSRCGKAMRKNARACLTCHDPADPKLRECR